MPNPAYTDEEILRRVAVWEGHGRSTRGAAQTLGIDRRTLRHTLDVAIERGLLNVEDVSMPNPSRLRPAIDIIASRKDEFLRYRQTLNFRKPVLVNVPRPGPFALVMLGDPHLDSPGSDLNLWERWVDCLDRPSGVYGCCIGDWLDNWPRVLGFLYGEAEASAGDGWVLLQHYLEQMRGDLLCTVLGNHDAWAAQGDPFGQIMRGAGVIARKHGLRLAIATPGAEPVTVALRHDWKGRSQFNPVHGVARGAREQVDDDIIVGGHIHSSGHQVVVHRNGEALSHCYRIGAFKLLDEYAERHGFPVSQFAPGVFLVVDPARPRSDPQRVAHFYDPEEGRRYLDALRMERAA